MNDIDRPTLIGITSYERNERDEFLLPACYVDALRRAGAIPVLLPPGERHLSTLLNMLDGIILSGGVDIDPARYGGSQHPQVQPPNPERDASEIELVERVLALELPTLAICRGVQLLNVALGGTLIEHLPDEVGTEIAHETEGKASSHPVAVEPTSRLATLMGAADVTPTSWHHQAIRRVATGLRVVARAADGTIEAVEHDEHPWLIGVQWHPEMSAADDPTQQRIFDAFVGAAREYRTANLLHAGSV